MERRALDAIKGVLGFFLSLGLIVALGVVILFASVHDDTNRFLEEACGDNDDRCAT